jgi:hypothetical protein
MILLIYPFFRRVVRCGNGTKVLRVNFLDTPGPGDRRRFGPMKLPELRWKALDLADMYLHFAPGVAPKKNITGGASEVAQDVCGTLRRDRDGDYPCW